MLKPRHLGLLGLLVVAGVLALIALILYSCRSIGQHTRANWASIETQPILASKTVEPSKFALIVGHKNMTERKRLGSNKQVVCPDRLAALFKTSSKQAIRTIGRRLERQDFEAAENCGELRRKPR